MKVVQLKNRPAKLPPRTRIVDFEVDGRFARVSLRLLEGADNNVRLDAQAFEVDAKGRFVTSPDGRPSRTPGTTHVVVASGLGNTHTLLPGWVRVVGDYDATTFEKTAPRGTGKPPADTPPDRAVNPTGQYYDEAEGVGYRWDEGVAMTVAKGKVDELVAIARNSAPLSGIDF